MNSLANLLKFIFSVEIFLLHLSMYLFDGKLGLGFQGAYIYVEWFFIFAGFTMAKKIDSLDKNCDVFTNSCVLIKNRVLKVLPYYFVSCTIALILRLIVGDIVINGNWMIHKIIHEYLFLQMTSIEAVSLVDTSWFLSSLWIAFIILVPFGVKYRRKFFRFSILIYLIIIYYFHYVLNEGLWGPTTWTIFGYKGTLRAIGAVALGFFGYELSYLIRKLENLNITISTIVTLGYGYLIYYIYVVDDSYLYYFIPIFFMLLITLQMSIKKYSFLPDGVVSRFLGKFSMILYLNHAYFFVMIDIVHSDVERADQANIVILYTLLTSLIIYFGSEIIKNIIEERRDKKIVNKDKSLNDIENDNLINETNENKINEVSDIKNDKDIKENNVLIREEIKLRREKRELRQIRQERRGIKNRRR